MDPVYAIAGYIAFVVLALGFGTFIMRNEKRERDAKKIPIMPGNLHDKLMSGVVVRNSEKDDLRWRS